MTVTADKTTAGRVVRVSSANTMVDASRVDAIDELSGLMFKDASSNYLLPGSVVTGLSSLTAGAVYYLSTGGQLTDPEAMAALQSALLRLIGEEAEVAA